MPKNLRQPTLIELWYLDCLRLLTGHLQRPPSITELSAYCERATFPTWSAMLRLEAKGRVRRNDARRFEVIEATE